MVEGWAVGIEAKGSDKINTTVAAIISEHNGNVIKKNKEYLGGSVG